jgi:peptidoglycan DL-endopeptidase CwlO
VKSLTLTMEALMRLRPTGSAAVVLAAVTLAVTAATPRPAQAFFFLPMLFQNQPMQQQPQQGRAPSDNKWRDEGARPIKPSTTTRSRDDDDKPSSSSAGKKAKTSTKSEAKTNSGQTSRSWSAKEEPPASKSSSRASTAARTRPGNSGGAKTPAQEPSSGGTAASTQQATPGAAASTNAQQASSTGPGSNLGDTLDEKLGDVFKARIDELLKQPSK